MNEKQFVSEPIKSESNSVDTAAMARGEPGLARRFAWRNQKHEVADVLEVWTTSAPEGGRGESYLRRHWYKLLTTDGTTMTLYCERQPKPGKSTRHRWWLYTVNLSWIGLRAEVVRMRRRCRGPGWRGCDSSPRPS